MSKKFLGLSLIFVVGVLFLSGCGKEDVSDYSFTPEMGKSNLPPSNNDCKTACDNYVERCLVLVPGADHVLFEDGRTSCLEQCAEWDGEKVKCIAESLTCPEMSDICKL